MVYITTVIEQGRQAALGITDEIQFHARNLFSFRRREQISKVIQDFSQAFRNATRQCTTVLAQRNQVYNHIAELATIQMPIFYPGSAGFILGAVLGICLGLSWNQNIVPTQRMKAVVSLAYDGLDALSCVDDAIIPTLTNPQQIIVQVKSASVDIVDIKICCGYGRSLRRFLNMKTKSDLPIILGRDCSGIVVDIGPKVNKFDIGDEVWFVAPFWSSGTLSEYVITTESMVSKKPKDLGFEEASSLPYSGCLAYNACLKAGIIDNFHKKKRVLIHSGVSPVGCIACQITKLYNCEVTVTCSAKADPVARTLKADKIVVYGNIEMENELAQDKFDVVLNTVGGVEHESCLKLCKPDGIVVSTVPEHIFNDEVSFPRSLFNYFYLMAKCFFKRWFGNPNEWNGFDFSASTLDKVGTLVDKFKLKPIVDKVYWPHDAVIALQHCDSVDAIGKTVVTFRNNLITDR